MFQEPLVILLRELLQIERRRSTVADVERIFVANFDERHGGIVGVFQLRIRVLMSQKLLRVFLLQLDHAPIEERSPLRSLP